MNPYALMQLLRHVTSMHFFWSLQTNKHISGVYIACNSTEFEVNTPDYINRVLFYIFSSTPREPTHTEKDGAIHK